MSLETARQVAQREHDRQQELVDALEARHGKEIAWVLRAHATMLYLTSSMVPPEEFFNDPRVAAVTETGREALTKLIAESVNVILIEFILKRPLTAVEARTYADELQLTLEALLASEVALLNEFKKP